MQRNQTSELMIITKSKDLCKYIMTITQNSPKQFRFTYISRLQNLSLSIVEYTYRANDVFVSVDNKETYFKRLELQQTAMTDLKLLAYFAELALEQKCILTKQYEQISKISTDCLRLLGAWIIADKKRFMP